jgi:hypothetical protein
MAKRSKVGTGRVKPVLIALKMDNGSDMQLEVAKLKDVTSRCISTMGLNGYVLVDKSSRHHNDLYRLDIDGQKIQSWNGQSQALLLV